MANAARAIIIENDQMLVMQRQKNNQLYYTLVGGRQNDGESIEECLVREIREETGLKIKEYNLVYTEKHNDPVYNDQFIFIATIEPHEGVALETMSEEALLNQNPYHENKHTPMWVPLKGFGHLPFRTPALGAAIQTALKKGFPRTPVAV